MEEPIGNASMRAMAWAEYTARFLNPLAEKAAQRLSMRTYVFKDEPSGPHRNLNMSATEESGQPVYELPHFTDQTHFQQLPHRRLANRGSGSTSAINKENHPGSRTVFPAPARNTNLTTKLRGREAENQASDKVATKIALGKRSSSTPYIDVVEVAEKVYNLMRHDLVLERERTTRFGG